MNLLKGSYVLFVLRLGDRVVLYAAELSDNRVVVDREALSEMLYLLLNNDARLTMLVCRDGICSEDSRLARLPGEKRAL